MVGFSFGWPAFAIDASGARKLKFRSHIMGVLPAWHGRGIGLIFEEGAAGRAAAPGLDRPRYLDL